jgi:uncharacterized protein (TIRG00374 family)
MAGAPLTPHPMEISQSRWNPRHLAIAIALAAAGYLGVALWGGWNEMVAASRRVGVTGICAALALSLLNYCLRFVRWQLYLDALGHRIASRVSAPIYFGGFALTVTPGKAGEMMRSVLLKKHGVPYAHSIAAFMSERLSDLLAIVLLALCGLYTYPRASLAVLAGAGIGVVALVFLSRRALPRAGVRTSPWLSNGRIGKFIQQAHAMLRAASQCHTPTLLWQSGVLSVLAWSAEAVAFFFILRWLGVDVQLEFAVFVYAASILAGVITLLPGGLGGTEAVMIALLVGQGIPPGTAAAATMLIRLTTLWFAVGLGAVALALQKSDRAKVQ